MLQIQLLYNLLTPPKNIKWITSCFSQAKKKTNKKEPEKRFNGIERIGVVSAQAVKRAKFALTT